MLGQTNLNSSALNECKNDEKRIKFLAKLFEETFKIKLNTQDKSQNIETKNKLQTLIQEYIEPCSYWKKLEESSLALQIFEIAKEHDLETFDNKIELCKVSKEFFKESSDKKEFANKMRGFLVGDTSPDETLTEVIDNLYEQNQSGNIDITIMNSQKLQAIKKSEKAIKDFEQKYLLIVIKCLNEKDYDKMIENNCFFVTLSELAKTSPDLLISMTLICIQNIQQIQQQNWQQYSQQNHQKQQNYCNII